MRRPYIFLPLICGLMLAGGVVIGSFIGAARSGGNEGGSYEKIRAVLSYVQQHYVDTVNTSQLTDKTLATMLQNLDPHSDYFTAEEIKAMSEPLQGNFEGIGIEYNFVRDTLVVLAVIPGGPSERAGLQTGDRIIKANDTALTGPAASEKFVKSKLRGPKDTKVIVTVKRPGQRSLITVPITRGSIPIVSIDAAYMIDDQTGYIRLLRFSETSYDEFNAAIDSLLSSGMKNLVLDLRGNGGGLLSAAVSIADEFLPEGKQIVYTKGRADGEEHIVATKAGRLEKMPVALLVDENSASASEIVAGALQDNDRGTIVGRRTFGKGLVQEERRLYDGSAFRLTIARYYTPTGRCIQKPYDKGLDAYAGEEEQRYRHGELLNRDSIHFADSLKFKTPGGKIVYGGGGIMPDLFVPLDTAGGTEYLNNLFYENIFTIWALEYAQQNRDRLRTQGIDDFIRNFEITAALTEELVACGEKNGVKKNPAAVRRSLDLIHRYMKANIARSIWGDEGYLHVWNQLDPAVAAAAESFH